ncbi:hypothetical protein, partial [Prevotella melaninogenica]
SYTFFPTYPHYAPQYFVNNLYFWNINTLADVSVLLSIALRGVLDFCCVLSVLSELCGVLKYVYNDEGLKC